MPGVSISAGALRGALVGVCSALTTGAVHAAGGGSVSGAALSLVALLCGSVGAAASAVRVWGRVAGLVVPTLGLGIAQLIGHLVLTLAAHHAGHVATSSMGMLAAHALGTLALAALICLAEFLYRSVGSVLCWLRPVDIHRSRPKGAAVAAPTETPPRPVLLRCGFGMRAPPRPAAAV
ncbi:hypothetical protein BCA37_16655 [Mycobacterium sp. djl-10]|nr:hypothetical protein BCA37_16655 [Mycobacterium sp. djl-10]